MIPYIEVRDKYTRLPFAILEPQECWFELSYYGVGDFEVYVQASRTAVASLKNGNYISLPHLPYVWAIESVENVFEAGAPRMISAKGRQAKAILGKRIINEQAQLAGDLTTAVFDLIEKHAGTKAETARRIEGLESLTSVIAQPITETQVSYENLLTYTESILKAYETGAELTITDENEFRYNIYRGADRSGEVIFSQTFDNLLESFYTVDTTKYRTFALVGGQGEGTERVLTEINDNEYAKGIDRAELFVDAKDISSKYKDANGEEKELDLSTSTGIATYKNWLSERGRAGLAENAIVETFDGEIDTTNSPYKYGEDFFLGDIVRVQDEYLGVYITPRILKYTMRQDREYRENVEFGG